MVAGALLAILHQEVMVQSHCKEDYYKLGDCIMLDARPLHECGGVGTHLVVHGLTAGPLGPLGQQVA